MKISGQTKGEWPHIACSVFSTYINAWTIQRGLAKLDIPLNVISDTEGLLARSNRSLIKGEWLFFTEESSLLRYYDAQDYHFFPRELDKNLIDDKFAFAKALIAMGEYPIACWDLKDIEPCETLEFPIYLKAKHSWFGTRKLPRGYLCNTPADLGKALKTIESLDISKDLFFLQRLLPGDEKNNISTCGFFDYHNPHRNVIVVTQKVLSTDGKIGFGSIVETIQDPELLRARTHHILTTLRYTGPFELEFLYDARDQTYYVLELNPRFWMQHGIFIEGYENRVIRAYLELDEASEWYTEETPFHPLAWVNQIDFLRAIKRRNIAQLKIYVDTYKRQCQGAIRVLGYPTFTKAFQHLVRGSL